MVLFEEIINERLPSPNFQAPPMELVALELAGQVLDPVPVLVQKDMLSDAMWVESFQTSHPPCPLKDLAPNQ